MTDGGYAGGRSHIVAPQAQARVTHAAALSSFSGQQAVASVQPDRDWNGVSGNGGLEENQWSLTESYRPKSPSGPIGPPQRARSPVSAKPSLGITCHINCVHMHYAH